MEMIAIFDFIMQIFECIQDRRSEPEMIAAVKEDMANPKRRHYRGIVQTLRQKEDLHGRELFQEARAVYGTLKDADAEDIDEMVDDAVKAAHNAGIDFGVATEEEEDRRPGESTSDYEARMIGRSL